jgi:hypothetical protein
MNSVDLGAAALLEVGLASVTIATVALLGVRSWSDQNSIARAKEQSQAHLLEVRVYRDDPRQVLRSQRALIVDNLRLIRLLLRPLVLLAIPLSLAMWQLDARYGRAPLRVGEAVVVSAESHRTAIAAPDSVLVETPPVYSLAASQTSWRIRPLRAVSGTVKIDRLGTRIVAGSGIAYLPQPLVGRNGIEIPYPRATIFGLHWIVWFLILSSIAGFALRRPLRVAF